MSKTSLILAAMFATIALTPAAHADQDSYKPITSQQFNSLLPGKTIKGEYRFLRERSKTFNFKETHNVDGTTLYKEGKISEKGVWYTLGKQKICYRYPSAPDMPGAHCFWVFKSEGCYYGYGLNNMTLKQVPRDFNDWEARWIIDEDGGSCAIPVG